MLYHLTTTSVQYAAFLTQQKLDVQTLPQQHHYDVGALVWLKDPTQSTIMASRKFCNLWTGPFLVLETLSNRTVKLLRPTQQSPRQVIKVSVDRLRPYITPVYQPWMDGEHTFKFPLYILATKISHNKIYYKIQWLSKETLPDTWELGETLPVQMVFNYEELLLNKERLPLPPTAALFTTTPDQ